MMIAKRHRLFWVFWQLAEKEIDRVNLGMGVQVSVLFTIIIYLLLFIGVLLLLLVYTCKI